MVLASGWSPMPISFLHESFVSFVSADGPMLEIVASQFVDSPSVSSFDELPPPSSREPMVRWRRWELDLVWILYYPVHGSGNVEFPESLCEHSPLFSLSLFLSLFPAHRPQPGPFTAAAPDDLAF